jgi:6-phosphogluconolactonase
MAAGTHPTGVVVDPTGKFLYVANQNSDNISSYTIAAGSGALSTVSTTAAATKPSKIVIVKVAGP